MDQSISFLAEQGKVCLTHRPADPPGVDLSCNPPTAQDSAERSLS